MAFGTVGEKAGVSAAPRGSVSPALGSGVSKQEMRGLSVSPLWSIRPREAGLLLSRCILKILIPGNQLNYSQGNADWMLAFLGSSFS